MRSSPWAASKRPITPAPRRPGRSIERRTADVAESRIRQRCVAAGARRVVQRSHTEDQFSLAEPVDVSRRGLLDGSIHSAPTGLHDGRRTRVIPDLKTDHDGAARPSRRRLAGGDEPVAAVAEADQPAGVEVTPLEVDIMDGHAIPGAVSTQDRQASHRRRDPLGVEDEQQGGRLGRGAGRRVDERDVGHRRFEAAGRDRVLHPGRSRNETGGQGDPPARRPSGPSVARVSLRSCWPQSGAIVPPNTAHPGRC